MTPLFHISAISLTHKVKTRGVADTAKSKPNDAIDTAESKLSGIVDITKSDSAVLLTALSKFPKLLYALISLEEESI
jgi:hypothetical protein